MSCYHPMLGQYVGELTPTGKKKYKITSSFIPGMEQIYPGSVQIPCGRCIGCRLNYSREWADRMALELETAGCAVFVTLTYDNDHVPVVFDDDTGEALSFTLCKRDVQLFMKRLRKEFPDKTIRFYLAGEYGETTYRPHYHCILFGLRLGDFNPLDDHGRNELGQKYYISDRLTKIWSCGHCLLAAVSWQTFAYVSRYVTKKIGTWLDPSMVLDALPEFSLMSRRPGIGREYLDLHPECLDYTSISLGTESDARKISIPKYYLKQFELRDPERYAIMKKERKEFAQDRMILKLQRTGLSYLDYLEVEENNKFDQIKVLKRNRV